MSDKQKFAFDKVNFILLAVGMAIVIIGFLLMTGPSSSETVFEPDIFSARRIKVAPVVCLFGFLSMIYAVLRKPKTRIKISYELVGSINPWTDSGIDRIFARK